MAIAKVTCTCKECGKEFEVRKNLRNRTEADWFEEHCNYDLCPACYQEGMMAETKSKANKLKAEYNVPAIEGVSEKQIDYAEKLRNNFLLTRQDQIKRNLATIDHINNVTEAELKAQMQSSGKTEEELKATLKKNLEKLYADPSYKVLKLSNASEIIDMLKNL